VKTIKSIDVPQKQSIIERLISLLQGASWALAVLGAFYAFSLLSPFGFFAALLAMFLGMLPGFVLVVICELAHLQFEKFHELKKQTALLEQILENSNNDTTISHN
jgi:hypothetical protein